MGNQINFNTSPLNWPAVPVCLVANAAFQVLANKIGNVDEESSTLRKVAVQAAGPLMGALFVLAIVKPLAERLAIVITPAIVIQVAVFQAIAQVVYHTFFLQPVVKPPEEDPPQPVEELNDLKSLLTSYDAKWDPVKKEYVGIQYNPERLVKRFNECGNEFDPKIDLTKNHGYIEKKEIPEGSKIFVRADLHGDLKSLIENLKAMQKDGLLDENFKCKSNVYMVFCGDYMDRGSHSLEVAEFLATLKLENPEQVSLIRGNHEYLFTNYMFGRRDANFMSFLKDHSAALENFYKTMPLSLYMAEEGGEFIQFTHGLFELHVDPSEMLEGDETRMVISKDNHSFSERVQKLAAIPPKSHLDWVYKFFRQETEPTKYQLAARRIVQLKEEEFDRSTQDTTAYNWGDVNNNKARLGSLGNRQWRLPPEDVKHALRLMGELRKVKLLFRGHQHKFQHGVYNDKVVVTTLPVGMDGAYDYLHFPGQLDRVYILEAQQNVRDWTKRAFLRKMGATKVEITDAYPIFSAAE